MWGTGLGMCKGESMGRKDAAAVGAWVWMARVRGVGQIQRYRCKYRCGYRRCVWSAGVAAGEGKCG